jgi:DNA-binding NarL/FixJ family response regulator
MNSKLRVYLADDHPIVRGGLKSLIDAQIDMVVVGEAGDGAATIRDVLDLMPDIAVIDVSMPTVNGIEATDSICQQAPRVGVVALTAFEDRGYLQILLKAGAKGYVVKRSAAEDLVRAIRVVAGGETYIDPAVAGELVAAVSTSLPAPMSTEAELSSRESEVLRLIAEGHGIKAIAAKLNVGVRTVETYKARGMGKLGLKTRVNIIRYAVQQGWLKDG